MEIDRDGLCVLSGSACYSENVAFSHVVDTMGLGRVAGQAIRVSLTWNVTEADVQDFIQAYARLAGAPAPAVALV